VVRWSGSTDLREANASLEKAGFTPAFLLFAESDPQLLQHIRRLPAFDLLGGTTFGRICDFPVTVFVNRLVYSSST
jgi:hypothetical protein